MEVSSEKETLGTMEGMETSMIDFPGFDALFRVERRAKRQALKVRQVQLCLGGLNTIPCRHIRKKVYFLSSNGEFFSGKTAEIGARNDFESSNVRISND